MQHCHLFSLLLQKRRYFENSWATVLSCYWKCSSVISVATFSQLLPSTTLTEFSTVESYNLPYHWLKIIQYSYAQFNPSSCLQFLRNCFLSLNYWLCPAVLLLSWTWPPFSSLNNNISASRENMALCVWRWLHPGSKGCDFTPSLSECDCVSVRERERDWTKKRKCKFPHLQNTA